MKKTARDLKERYRQAEANSWWHCQEPTCSRAFQKSESAEDSVCPYCDNDNILPWDSAMMNNPILPQLPESGQPYAHHPR